MSTPPLLQLALDYISLPPALAMAQLLHKEVDIIECGTPLCAAEGLNAVSAVRHLCPDNLILADYKVPDVGGLSAKIAFDAGANWITVIGCAPLITVKEALEEANSRDCEILVELTGLQDIGERAKAWKDIGVRRVVYHRGWDEGNVDKRLWEEKDFDLIRQLADTGFKVSVAGGLSLDLIPRFEGVPISVFIVGRAIRETPDPPAAARQFREAIAACCG